MAEDIDLGVKEEVKQNRTDNEPGFDVKFLNVSLETGLGLR